MLNTVRPTQAARHFQADQNRHTLPTRTLMAVAVIAALLAGSAAAWQHHQSHPITDDQRATLTGLADRAAERTDQSRQKIWANLRANLGVRKIQDLRQKDFDRTQTLILQEMR